MPCCQGQDFDRMFDAIAPRYDLLNRILTFGMDVRWRKLAVRSLGLAAGSTVLDVGCGTGDLCRVLGGHRLHSDRLDGGVGKSRADGVERRRHDVLGDAGCRSDQGHLLG